MSPKYWASGADLSADSSADGSQRESRDQTVEEENEEKGPQPIGSRDQNVGILTRIGETGITLPRLPRLPGHLEPHQHASLFYLSLIEGRCKSQAAASINAGRPQDMMLPEDHTEVLVLARHLFAEMQRELVKAGMIPEEFAGPNLPDLRQYLYSFDTLLNNIATQRAHNIPEQHSHQALPGLVSAPFNSAFIPDLSFSFDSRALAIQKSIMPPQGGQKQLDDHQSASKLLNLFNGLPNNIYNTSIYANDYNQ